MKQTLARFLSFVKTYRIILGAGTLFLVVVVIVALQIRSNSQLPQTIPSLTNQGNPDQTQTSFFNLTFSGTAPAIPEKLWSAKVLRFDVAQKNTLLDDLIARYQLSPSPHVANVWNGPEYSLEFDEQRNEYRLSKNFTRPDETPELVTQQSISTLIAKAQQEVLTTFPKASYVAFPDKSELLIAQGEYDAAPLGSATHLRIPFAPSFNSVAVFQTFDPSFPLNITLNAGGELITLVARPFTTELTPEKQFFSISTQEALQQIERGDASVINSHSPGGAVDLSKVVRGEFERASLEYRIDPDSNTALPYYHFVGTLVNLDNNFFTANVITPAIVLTP